MLGISRFNNNTANTKNVSSKNQASQSPNFKGFGVKKLETDMGKVWEEMDKIRIDSAQPQGDMLVFASGEEIERAANPDYIVNDNLKKRQEAKITAALTAAGAKFTEGVAWVVSHVQQQ